MSLPTAADPTVAPAPDPAHQPATEAPANSWTVRPRMPTERLGLVAATVNGIVYAIGGASSSVLAKVEAYNPSTSTLVAWTPKAPLPEARAFANGAVAINGKIYVPGGLNANLQPTRSLFVYDVAGNSWSAKAQMPIGSARGASVAIGGKLYVLATQPGADESYSGPTRLFRYDPALNLWSERAAAPHPHYRGVAAVISDQFNVAGKLYVAGGMTYDSDGYVNESGYLDVYNPATNSWTTKAPMRTPRFAAAGGVLNGRLFVAGGRTEESGFDAVPTLEHYYPATDYWSTRNNMRTARWATAAAVVGRVLYVLGGTRNAIPVTTNEAYTCC